MYDFSGQLQRLYLAELAVVNFPLQTRLGTKQGTAVSTGAVVKASPLRLARLFCLAAFLAQVPSVQALFYLEPLA